MRLGGYIRKCAGRRRTLARAQAPASRRNGCRSFSPRFSRGRPFQEKFAFHSRFTISSRGREREGVGVTGRGRGKKEGRYRTARGYSYELLSWWCGGRQFAFPVQRISFGVLGSFPKQTKTGRLNGHRIATAAPNHRKRERNTNSTGTSARCLHTSYGGSF